MRERFIELYRDYIKREGADELLKWICESDFFKAPASTRFHGAYEGGLVEHSVNVFQRLVTMTPPSESVAIVSLLHDICKANFYTVSFRNQKNEHGVWVQVPYYTIDDKLPYGHGEKSVYIISQFIKLTPEEAMAIRWHMGGFDEAVKGGSFALSGAWEKYPLGMLLHCADLQATYLDENNGGKTK